MLHSFVNSIWSYSPVEQSSHFIQNYYVHFKSHFQQKHHCTTQKACKNVTDVDTYALRFFTIKKQWRQQCDWTHYRWFASGAFAQRTPENSFDAPVVAIAEVRGADHKVVARHPVQRHPWAGSRDEQMSKLLWGWSLRAWTVRKSPEDLKMLA